MSKPLKLGDVLGDLIGSLGIERKLDEARALEAWKEIAAPQAVAVTEGIWLKGDQLIIRIASATWRNELHRTRSAWRDRINAHLGKEVVKEIVFR
jgi:predicted nucleic acid-binding Zn ribbon protein